MTHFTPLPLDESWLEMRRDLHRRYEELVGLNDSSRLGYLHGAPQEWDESQIVDKWQEAANAADRRKDAINHVYIHVPFCKSICNFCNYERLRPSSPALIEQFADRIFRSLHAIGPVVKPLRWHTLYMGGGTASVLPAPLLEKVLTAVDDTLRWHPNSTRFFEFDPAVFNQAKLDVLIKHGFEHFSFGVQTLSAEVNQAHNRGPQSFDLVQRRFDELRGSGVYNISCDFLLGLKGTTPEGIVSEIERVLALAPRWIDLYYLTPTSDYIETHFGGSYEAFWAHIKPFHERVPELLREVSHKHGFRVRRGHGHNIILYRQMGPHERNKHKKGGIFSYTQLVDQQRRPLHLLGLGTSARSLIFGQAAIECRPPEERGDSADGDHYYFGHEYGMEGEVRLFLSHILRDNDVVDREMFTRIFGMDITEAIPTALSVWMSQGLVEFTDAEMRLKREERRQRVRTLLWAVPDHRLEYEVVRYEKNIEAQARKAEHDARTGGRSDGDGRNASGKAHHASAK
ncbi:MAG: radical SAM protein [Alphaproteobacteria bacterium]|nr:radical SAM protein [Alphaproteobacteria bacterium]